MSDVQYGSEAARAFVAGFASGRPALPSIAKGSSIWQRIRARLKRLVA